MTPLSGVLLVSRELNGKCDLLCYVGCGFCSLGLVVWGL